MPTEQFEAETSACTSSDVQTFSNPYDNLTSVSQQSSVLSDMRTGNSTASSYLPDVKIEGLDNSPATKPASVSADSTAHDGGAISNARDYWNQYSDDAVKEGGISGFANYLVGNVMGSVVEGVQAAKDAREHWANVANTSDSEVTRALAGAAHDLLVPAAILDHMGTSLDNVASANQGQVADGLKQGVLKESYGSAKDVANTVNWLDKQIPRDGKPETEDRRTALLVSLASAEAQKTTSDPKKQEEVAYDRLFSLRAGLANSSYAEQLPAGMKGRELDPDIAAAEHFFEVSKRVASDTMDMYIPLAGRKEIPTNGYVTAPVWATISSGYGVLKSAGVLDGSNAGEHQSSWEMAGIMRGLEINRR